MNDVPFKFGLERVRELREHEEDRAREELAASLHRRARGAAMLRAAQDLIEDARDGRRTVTGPVSAQDLLGQQRWLERLEKHRVSADRELQRSDLDLVDRRADLHEAYRKRESLDKLKDRQREAHDLKTARRDGAALDEVALTAHVRRAGRLT